MGRILPTLSPRDMWTQRHDITPLWWRDMARWCAPLVALCIVGSYTVWEPIARAGALLLLWIVVCVALGSEPRRDDDRRVPPRTPGPRGGLGRATPQRPVRRAVPRGPRAPQRHQRRAPTRRRQTPVG